MGQVLWERRHKMGIASLAKLVVSDEGFSVLLTFGNVISVVAPNGTELLRVVVGEDWHSERGNAETWFSWTGGSQAWFFSHEQIPYFALRATWGDPLVLKLTPPEIVQQPDPVLAAACDEEEVRATEHGLALAGQMTRKIGQRDGRQVDGCLANLLFKPRRVGGLRAVEQVSCCSSRISSAGFGFSVGWVGFRPAVQQVLRRLGEPPSGAAYVFSRSHAWDSPERGIYAA